MEQAVKNKDNGMKLILSKVAEVPESVVNHFLT